MEYNSKQTANLFNYNETGVIELLNRDFSVNGIGEIIVAHPMFSHKNGLIMFYAPWCPHCKKHINTFTNLAMMNGTQFPIAAVNCENKANDSIKKYAKIAGFPTLKYVHKDGTLSTYTGDRNLKALQKFICNKSGICN